MFCIATFNVKDLFAAGPEPDGEARVTAKLDSLSVTLGAVDADVVGLQEVGSIDLLDRLCDRLGAKGPYRERVVGTADSRGIRNALVSRVPLLGSLVHAPARLDFPVFRAGDPTPFGDRIPMRRGIVQGTVDAGSLGHVHVLVAHLKSNRRLLLSDDAGKVLTARELAEGELRSLVWRCSEALFVRGLVDGLVSKDPEARVAVVGDLNDRPGSLVTRILCGDGPPGELLSAAELIPAERRFSILHNGRPDLFDYVLVTPNLYARATGAQLYNETLQDHTLGGSAVSPERPGRTADEFAAVARPDSDHAPLAVRFG
jgi:endonuclease/exonuclease/phosphatase family metal-dependent hydrolase